MTRFRIGLRLHIFLAFLIVFLFSFAVIIVSFNIFVQDYINNDAKDKLNQSIQLARNLADVKKNSLVFSTSDNDTEIIENTIIRALSGSTDVRIALISSDDKVLYPPASEYMSGKNTPLNILHEMNEHNISLDVSSVHNLEIEEAYYYVSSVPIIVNPIGGEPSDNVMYLLLYLDASPYLLFLQSINQILFAILVITLILTLFTSLLVSNGIIRSIRKLTVFASRIGRGVFDRQPFQFFDKELDNLASDMNGMADKLEQTDKEQKTFFQNASHELRTPLM
jgi:two-component system sensor histidine kinase CssS